MVAIVLSLLAITVNIVLEINLNSSSSNDRGEGTSDFKNQNFTNKSITFYFKINQLTSYFATQGIQKEKERKHVSGSGEIEKKKKDWKKMESKFLKSYSHLRCYDFSLWYMSLLVFALDNSSCFCSWFPEDYYEMGQSKYILRKFEISARQTCEFDF